MENGSLLVTSSVMVEATKMLILNGPEILRLFKEELFSFFTNCEWNNGGGTRSS